MTLILFFLLGCLVAVVVQTSKYVIPRQRYKPVLEVNYNNIRNLEHDIYKGQEELLLHFPNHGQMECGHCRSYLGNQLAALEKKHRLTLTREDRVQIKELREQLEIAPVKVIDQRPCNPRRRPAEIPAEAEATVIESGEGLVGTRYTWYDTRTGQQKAYFLPGPAQILSRRGTGDTGPR